MTAIIETEKLTKSYGVHRGIIDLDLVVNEGEAFGFLGPNGAGKTTTIRTLLDHLRPTSGRARVFGIDTRADPSAIHARVGYLPGEFSLYDKLTGGDTIEYFANLRGGVDTAYQADLIDRLEIDPTRKFKEYSKGNKQKIGLVIALQHRPELLILDEPTSGTRSSRPADVLRRHPRGEGRGTHDLPVQPHPLRGRADVRPRGDHPRWPAGPDRPCRGPARPRPPPGRTHLRRGRPVGRVCGAPRRDGSGR